MGLVSQRFVSYTRDTAASFTFREDLVIINHFNVAITRELKIKILPKCVLNVKSKIIDSGRWTMIVFRQTILLRKGNRNNFQVDGLKSVAFTDFVLNLISKLSCIQHTMPIPIVKKEKNI